MATRKRKSFISVCKTFLLLTKIFQITLSLTQWRSGLGVKLSMTHPNLTICTNFTMNIYAILLTGWDFVATKERILISFLILLGAASDPYFLTALQFSQQQGGISHLFKDVNKCSENVYLWDFKRKDKYFSFVLILSQQVKYGITSFLHLGKYIWFIFTEI